MTNPFILPLPDGVQSFEKNQFEEILANEAFSYKIDDFNVIEIRNQTASEFVVYLLKNLQSIDCILLNTTHIVTLKLS